MATQSTTQTQENEAKYVFFFLFALQTDFLSLVCDLEIVRCVVAQQSMPQATHICLSCLRYSYYLLIFMLCCECMIHTRLRRHILVLTNISFQTREKSETKNRTTYRIRRHLECARTRQIICSVFAYFKTSRFFRVFLSLTYFGQITGFDFK